MGVDAATCTERLSRLAQLVSSFRWLLNSYVIEFFTESHWLKLPQSWQDALYSADLFEVSRLLLQGGGNNAPLSKVYPLSLLAFSAAAHSLSLPRQPVDVTPHNVRVGSQLEGLEHVFRCHIKPKKQHEIKVFGEKIHHLSLETKCKNIVDVGSGQGHLSRYLAHKYGLSVTGVEGVGGHLTTAAKYDKDVEKMLAKRGGGGGHHGNSSDSGSLTHIEAMIGPEASIEDILLSHVEDGETTTGALCASSEDDDERYILVGLHTCGDLAPTILRVFAGSGRVVGVASVGCCYMKLTCEGAVCGYPMSGCGRRLECGLRYEAREVACHSNERYRERLQGSLESFHHLKVHCHRAAVEVLLRKRGLRRSQVRISKRVSKLPFMEYAHALLGSLATPSPPPAELDALRVLVEEEWRRVVMFFMLRLTLAPCVESVLLLDRAMFLIEQGYTDVSLYPLFDPTLSPRNHVVIATNKQS
ncbi:methyltransferase-like protein 25B [Halichondria panicea]|uniref:methyltransferase-like protein 25B n=1 Tax=Halichondria panicea TaxID=6063 RepID=UPI00312BCA26